MAALCYCFSNYRKSLVGRSKASHFGETHRDRRHIIIKKVPHRVKQFTPWVGLVTGGVGMFLNNAISAFVHAPYWVLTNYGALNSVPLNVSHPRVYWPLV